MKFIEKAIQIHGNKYNYEKVVYVGNNVKVQIFCNVHKEYFLQQPNNHLSGQGCPKCGKVKYSKNKTYTKEEYIEKATKIHGGKYDYNCIIYNGSKNKIDIWCNNHKGTFSIHANSHLKGFGCTKCYSNRINDTEGFVSKAKIKHGNNFSYEDTFYIKSTLKVKIFCNNHKGYFFQTPSNHLNGFGCNVCALIKQESKAVTEITDFLLQNNISYLKEYRFHDCKNILPLPFDFYLPEHNICIEYDGKQHFKKSTWYDDEGLKEIQKRDLIKTEYCIDNKIKLLRIKYTEDHISLLRDNLLR